MTEPDAVQPRGFLRRNLGPLAVAVVSFAGSLIVLLGVPALDAAGRAEQPQAVLFGDPVSYGGYEFELLDSREFVGTGEDGNGIPVGSALVAALLEVRAGSEADEADELFCQADLTSRAGGVERSWTTLSSPEQFGYAVGDASSYTCSPEGEDVLFEVVFLTPQGAYDGSTLDVEVNGIDGEVFRFERKS